MTPYHSSKQIGAVGLNFLVQSTAILWTLCQEPKGFLVRIQKPGGSFVFVFEPQPPKTCFGVLLASLENPLEHHEKPRSGSPPELQEKKTNKNVKHVLTLKTTSKSAKTYNTSFPFKTKEKHVKHVLKAPNLGTSSNKARRATRTPRWGLNHSGSSGSWRRSPSDWSASSRP